LPVGAIVLVTPAASYLLAFYSAAAVSKSKSLSIESSKGNRF